MNYTPEPDTLPARVLALFRRNPDEEYTDADLALKFGVPSARVKALLAACISHDLLRHDRAAGDSTKTWRAGPKLAAWLEAKTHEAAPPGNALPAPKQKKGLAVPLPELDLTKLQVRVGVPKPPRVPTSRAGTSKYDALFAMLTKAGQSIELPKAYQKTIAAAAKKRKKAGTGEFSLRSTSADTITLWRDA